MKRFVIIGTASVVPKEVKGMILDYDILRSEQNSGIPDMKTAFIVISFYDGRLPVRADNVTIQEATNTLNKHFEIQESKIKKRIDLMNTMFANNKIKIHESCSELFKPFSVKDFFKDLSLKCGLGPEFYKFDEEFDKAQNEFKAGENKIDIRTKEESSVEKSDDGEVVSYNIKGQVIPKGYQCKDPYPSTEFKGYMVKFFDPEGEGESIEIKIFHQDAIERRLIEKEFNCCFLPF